MPRLPSESLFEETEELAICLSDVFQMDAITRRLILQGKLGTEKIVVRYGPDRLILAPFICPLMEAAKACEIVRSENRRTGQHPSKVYIKRKSSWERLPNTAVLTLTEGGEVVLNHEIFAMKTLKGTAPP